MTYAAVIGSRFGPYVTRVPGAPRRRPAPSESGRIRISRIRIGYFCSSISTLSRNISPFVTALP